jgi:ketosteroid isomerase-like protein
MSREEQHASAIRSFYDDLLGGRAGFLDNLIADDAVCEVFGPPEVAWVGRFSGREEIRRLFGIIAETTDRSDPDLRPTFKEIVAQGDTVISTGTDRVRFLPGGRVCDAWWFHVFKFRDGKIVEMREYFDNTAALSACSR